MSRGALSFLVLLLTAMAARADDVGWPTETIVLKSGESIRGVTVTGDRKSIDFAEVVRPPGKPMFVVIRRVARDDIESWRKLNDQARNASLAQLARFRNRMRIDQINMDNVELAESEFEGFRCRKHDNPWFRVWSTADDETTRRCIVRIDQMFRAYRQLFPPRQSNRPLRVLLLDSLEQYGDYLRRHGLNVQNPAFYSQKQNLIVAASEVGDYGARLAETRKRHSRQVSKLERMDKEFLIQFQSLREDLKSAGFKPEEITFEKTARLRAWNDERDRQLKKIVTANRRNDTRFHELTQRMFRRMHHEAFHAYMENYVFPQRTHTLPRWYDEGLAQVFESGQLEAGMLRIDAPDRSRLTRLKEDFANNPRLSLLDLVSAQPRDFIDAHENPQANRYYLHAWAVAYYLTYIAPRTPDQIDAFARDNRNDPAARLAEFAGADLKQLDKAWRNAIIGLKTD